MEPNEPTPLEEAKSKLRDYSFRLVIWVMLLGAYTLFFEQYSGPDQIPDGWYIPYLLCACICIIFVVVNVRRVILARREIDKAKLPNEEEKD